MNQKKLKSAIAKWIKSAFGPRKIEPGLFHTTGQEPELESFNLDLLGDPEHNDLVEQMGFWDKWNKLPENGLVDFYIYTLGHYGELDTNILIRIKDGKMVQAFENHEGVDSEISLVSRHPETLVPFTHEQAREFLGISEDDIPPRRTFLVKTERSDCEPVTILGHGWVDIRRPNPWSDSNWKSTNEIRGLGSQIQDGDSIVVRRVGWGQVIGEVE